MLRASSISDDVIAERGYRSVGTAAEIMRLGFKQQQARTPALLMPIHDVHGELAGYSLRPDEPRVIDDRVVKYEQPKGSTLRLDVPPRCRQQLGNPGIALYVTEGSKKGDALASLGVCAVSLNGVWGWRGTNDLGGKAALADWDAIALNGRLVRIVFDSNAADKPLVAHALSRLKRFLESRSAKVELIYLPSAPDGRKQGVDDYLAAGGSLGAMQEFVTSEVVEPPDIIDELLPEIIVNSRHLHEIAQDCWDALKRQNDGTALLFERGGRLTTVREDADGRHFLREWGAEDVTFVLDRMARFVRVTDDGTVPGRLPADVVKDLLVAWQKPVPELVGIVGTPVFTADGTLVTTTGYQPETRLYYQPVGWSVREVPTQPSAADLASAKVFLLDEWLCDFPFVDQSSRANAIAAPLTPLVREMITGPTPLFAIDAPAAGSGKGLLADTIGLVVSGQSPSVMTEPRNPEEFRKRLTALFKDGVDVILLDNLKQRLDSAELAAALTATMWSDRILGATETMRAPNRALWIATGNNLVFDSDVARRAVWVRLDAKVDRPWERSGFRHDPLVPWVSESRHELVWSLLVLVQNWLATGRPADEGKPLGSFESWQQVVGGILKAAGIDGFLSNRDELYHTADRESEEWRDFVEAWWERFASRDVKASELRPLVTEDELLPSLIASDRGEPTDRQVATRLGKALTNRHDRRIGDRFIRIAGKDSHRKGTFYRLEPADDGGDDPQRSADVPQLDDPVLDSDAERADDAELVSGSPEDPPGDAPQLGADPSVSDLLRTPDQVPRVPHRPHVDSDLAPDPAEDGAPAGAHLPHHVPQAADGPNSDVGPDQGGSHCFSCGSDAWWYRQDGTGPVCSTCHPDPRSLSGQAAGNA